MPLRIEAAFARLKARAARLSGLIKLEPNKAKRLEYGANLAQARLEMARIAKHRQKAVEAGPKRRQSQARRRA